jgi:ATP-dependent DNA ligase
MQQTPPPLSPAAFSAAPREVAEADPDASTPYVLPVLAKGDRRWQIGFDPAGGGAVVTASGKDGGKVTVSRAAVKTNKSGRNVAQQAAVAVAAKFKTQTTREAFAVLRAADAAAGAPPAADAAAPPPPPRPVPMLVKDGAKVVAPERNLFPAVCMRKYDGVRCLVDAPPGSGGGARFTSRQRNSLDHLAAVFGEACARILSHLPPGSVLDGELVVLDGSSSGAREDFAATVSAAKTRANGVSEDARTRLCLVVFDVATGGPFVERLAALATAVHRAAAGDRVRVVEAAPVDCMAELLRERDRVVAAGGEGVVAKALASPYEPGKRPNTAAKFKSFDEEEGVVVAVDSGEGKEAGCAMFTVQMGAGSRAPTRMHPAGSLEERAKWLADAPRVVGKRVTVQFQGRSADGVVRFPVVKAIRDYE